MSDGGGDGEFYGTMILAVACMSAASFGLFLLKETVAGEVEANLVYDANYEARVLERIRPVGEAALPSTADSAAAAAGSAQVVPTPVAEKLSGPQVYNQACFACHGAGIGGAPKLGDGPDWEPRMAQGRDIVNQHVLEGYTGSAGYMPPKGGRIDLSDEEILAGLEYMLEQLP
ncbi:MAG: c-type cytochrome [Gammaproteobacteria bacterium]